MAIADLGCKVIATHNNSLSESNSIKLLVAMATVAFLIALGFAHIGAWFVLPFAGLEILAFAYAFYVVHLHASDFDSITIEDDRVVVERKSCERVSTTVFQRYWAQISVRDVESKNGIIGKSGLFISSHGKEVEFGKNFINDEQRSVLAHVLKQKLKNIN